MEIPKPNGKTDQQSKCICNLLITNSKISNMVSASSRSPGTQKSKIIEVLQYLKQPESIVAN